MNEAKLICRGLWKLFGSDARSFLERHDSNPGSEQIAEAGLIGAGGYAYKKWSDRREAATAKRKSFETPPTTAQSAAWSTHPLGVRYCFTGSGNCSARLSTRSGASSSSRAVTPRWTAVFAFEVGEMFHVGPGRFGVSSIHGT